jgi:alcohol dehydrogenase
VGIHNYAADDLRKAVSFLAEHPEYPFDSLVGRWFPLAEAEAAFAAARDAEAIRVGVKPG